MTQVKMFSPWNPKDAEDKAGVGLPFWLDDLIFVLDNAADCIDYFFALLCPAFHFPTEASS